MGKLRFPPKFLGNTVFSFLQKPGKDKANSKSSEKYHHVWQEEPRQRGDRGGKQRGSSGREKGSRGKLNTNIYLILSFFN